MISSWLPVSFPHKDTQVGVLESGRALSVSNEFTMTSLLWAMRHILLSEPP